MDKEKLQKKLEELKASRQKLMDYANQQLAHITGQIELLEEMLQEEQNEEQAK